MVQSVCNISWTVEMALVCLAENTDILTQYVNTDHSSTQTSARNVNHLYTALHAVKIAKVF